MVLVFSWEIRLFITLLGGKVREYVWNYYYLMELTYMQKMRQVSK